MEGGRIEIGRLMPVRSISKAQLTPSCLQFTTVSKPSPPPYPHFPTRDTTNTLLIILSLKNQGWTTAVRFSSTTMPGLVILQAWKNPATLLVTHKYSLSVSFVSYSHVDLQVFAPSMALVISWTRDCRSSDLIMGEMLLSTCNAAISLPQTSFGCFKPGVTRMSGMFRIHRSWSMCWKAAIPRWPLQGTTTKKVKKL